MSDRYRERMDIKSVTELDFAALSAEHQDLIIDAMIRKYAGNDPEVVKRVRTDLEKEAAIELQAEAVGP